MWIMAVLLVTTDPIPSLIQAKKSIFWMVRSPDPKCEEWAFRPIGKTLEGTLELRSPSRKGYLRVYYDLDYRERTLNLIGPTWIDTRGDSEHDICLESYQLKERTPDVLIMSGDTTEHWYLNAAACQAAIARRKHALLRLHRGCDSEEARAPRRRDEWPSRWMAFIERVRF